MTCFAEDCDRDARVTVTTNIRRRACCPEHIGKARDLAGSGGRWRILPAADWNSFDKELFP